MQIKILYLLIAGCLSGFTFSDRKFFEAIFWKFIHEKCFIKCVFKKCTFPSSVTSPWWSWSTSFKIILWFKLFLNSKKKVERCHTHVSPSVIWYLNQSWETTNYLMCMHMSTSLIAYTIHQAAIFHHFIISYYYSLSYNSHSKTHNKISVCIVNCDTFKK